MMLSVVERRENISVCECGRQCLGLVLLCHLMSHFTPLHLCAAQWSDRDDACAVRGLISSLQQFGSLRSGTNAHL